MNAGGTQLRWMLEQHTIDWHELSNLYRIAPLGEKKADPLQLAFTNSRLAIFQDQEKATREGLVEAP